MVIDKNSGVYASLHNQGRYRGSQDAREILISEGRGEDSYNKAIDRPASNDNKVSETLGEDREVSPQIGHKTKNDQINEEIQARQQEDKKSEDDTRNVRQQHQDQLNRDMKFKYFSLFKAPGTDKTVSQNVAKLEESLENERYKREVNQQRDSYFVDMIKELLQEPMHNRSTALIENPDFRKNLAEFSKDEHLPDGLRNQFRMLGANRDPYSTSSKDFCDEIAKIIAETKKVYLQNYEKALENYIAFFKQVSDILSELPKLISEGKDNKIKVNVGELRSLINRLRDEYKNQQLHPSSGPGVSQAEARDWAEKLGLTPSCVVPSANGGYVVKYDTSPLDKILEGLSALDGEISSAKYQAWKAGFDAQVEKINNYVQTLSQKYTTANSTYDNLVKVLSSTITAMYDADKEFLKN